MNQLQVYMCSLHLESPTHLPPRHPSRLSRSTGFGCIKCALAIYFPHGNVYVSVLCLRITLPGLPGLEQSHAPKARLQSARRATRRPPPCQQSPHRETHGGRVPAGCTLVNAISFNPRGSPTCKGGATVPLYRCTNRTSCQD